MEKVKKFVYPVELSSSIIRGDPLETSFVNSVSGLSLSSCRYRGRSGYGYIGTFPDFWRSIYVYHNNSIDFQVLEEVVPFYNKEIQEEALM